MQNGIITHPYTPAWAAARANPDLFQVWAEDFNTAELSTNVLVGKNLTQVVTNTGDVSLDPTYNGGVIALAATDGSVVDNDEAGILTTIPNLALSLTTGKRVSFRTRVRFAQTANYTQNIFVGLANTVAHETMIDTGGGPVASVSALAFYKVDSVTAGTGNVWNVLASKVTVQHKQTAVAAAVKDTWYWLEININPDASVDFLVDGVLVAREATPATYLPAVAIGPAYDLKIGAATDDQLYIDRFDLVVEK